MTSGFLDHKNPSSVLKKWIKFWDFQKHLGTIIESLVALNHHSARYWEEELSWW